MEVFAMAIIYHNYLLALGPKSDIKSLGEFLAKPEETVAYLSCELFKIYCPKGPRSQRLRDFGNCGSFSGSTTPWDITIGIDQIRRIKDDDFGTTLLKQCAESEAEIEYNDDDSSILFFTFKSAYSVPDEGFKKLSKQYSKVEFIIYGDSESGEDIRARIKKGKWKKDHDL